VQRKLRESGGHQTEEDHPKESQRRTKSFTETPPPLPQVPPPDDSPAPASQRLDMLVGKKIETTPTKKVSFMNDAEKNERQYDSNANNLNDEKLTRLERVEKDPNVRQKQETVCNFTS